MSQSTSIVTWPPQTQEGSGQYVGVALLAIPELATPYAASIFGGAVRAMLARAGIAQSEICGMFAGSSFLLYVTPVEDAKAALREIHTTVREMGFLDTAQIGFWDHAEGYWRTVHPKSGGDFEALLTPEEFKIHFEKLDAAKARLDGLLSVLRSHPKDESNGQ